MITADLPPVCIVNEYLSNAQSDEGRATEQSLREILRLADSSIFLGGMRRELLAELDEIIEEVVASASIEKSIDPIAVLIASKNARRFIELIPPSIPKPELSVEQDGEIAFEWIKSPEHYLSLSIGNHNFFHYAAILGPNRYHGKELLIDAFPEILIPLIHKTIG